MRLMKIVFDTNVYLAAIKKDSYAWEQLRRARPNGPYQLYISPDIILETQEKLEQKFHWDRSESARYVEAILVYATLVQPHQKISGVLQDEDDHIILECALEVHAGAIVTADRGLLRLKDFQGIAIIHPTMLQYLK
jgi:putative PIN family toxin of toxin-antitoxin system